MTINFSGKQLHALMIKNNKGLVRSAEKLGITPDELNDYLNCEFFEEDVLLNIFEKLKIYFVINEPGAVTPLALKQFEIYENKIKLLETTINKLATGAQYIYNVLKKTDPVSFEKFNCNESLLELTKMIEQINIK